MDDDADTLALFERAAMRSEAFSAIWLARDGQEALDTLSGRVGDTVYGLPDLIISDLKMPRIDGIALARQVKAHAGFRHLPVVILTSSELVQDHEAAMQAGCAGCYTKPPRVQEMLELFRSIAATVGFTAQRATLQT